MSCDEPVGWVESATLEGSSGPVRVIQHERRGHEILVRQADPTDEGVPRFPIFEGDQLVMMTALSHVGIKSQAESEHNVDLIHSVRIVPTRREGNVVYARTLRHGETDDGQRVHLAPGEQVSFEPGALIAELDAIDEREEVTESGYKPIAAVLSAWFSLGREDWGDSAIRYLLAAARRLDMANELFLRVRQAEDEMNSGPMPGPLLRRKLFAVIANTELAVISLARAIAMLDTAPTRFDVSVTMPESIRIALPAIKAIRDAYEHIDERAFGSSFRVANPVALSIFDYKRLAEEDLIVYGDHTLQITEQVDQVLRDGRAVLKEIVGTAFKRE